MDIKQATINLIKRTGDPTAPIKVQEAHKYAVAVGKMLVPVSNKDRVNLYTETLLSGLTDADEASKSPEFVMALCAMLAEALVQWVRKEGTQ